MNNSTVKIKYISERINIMNKKNLSPFVKTTLPIIGAVLLVAGAIAYICLKLADEFRYNEKWKDYDECGWH